MPGFDETGPRGLGPMTGRGLGYCVVPIGTSHGYTKHNEPYSDINQPYPGPFNTQPYAFHPPGTVPSYRVPFRRGRGRRSCGRGRFSGPGRGFGRRW